MRRILLLLLIIGFINNGVFGQNAVSSTVKPQATAKKQQVLKVAHNEADAGKVKWTVGNECMPGHIQAFQENKGQYFSLNNNWKVLYGTDYMGSYILFTDHGIINVLPQAVPMTENDLEGERIKKGESGEKENKQEEKENKKKLIYHTVTIEWEGANTNAVVEGVDVTPYHFGAVDPLKQGQSIDNIKGYKKLVYHDLYPGIDVEFTFHAGNGIEYAIKVKPGFDASVFKMKYKGQKGLTIDADGNIHLSTVLGDIIDHAPISSQEGNSIGSSFEKLSDNEIGFKLNNYDKSKGLLIDPWLVNPTVLKYVPYDCGMDAVDNVYVMGSGGTGTSSSSLTMYVQKYTTAGALSWTYTLSQYAASGFAESQSDMAVDPAGNTYVPSSYDYSNSVGQQYAMIKLNPGGTLNYFYNTYPGTYTVFEIWNVAYSCDYSTLIQAGSPNIYQEEVSIVNPTNGTLSGYSAVTTDQLGEIYTGCIAPNGNYYCIGANPQFCPASLTADSLVCYSISGGVTKQLWSANTGYSYDDYNYKSMYSIPTNGIAAGCGYVYTSDGYHLDQRSLTNGKLSKRVIIPGGDTAGCNSSWISGSTPATSGIAVDLTCGNVYAGSNGKVVVYDENLNTITTTGAYPGYVFDVSYNAGLVAAVGANATGTVGFVTQFVAQTCPGLTITHVNGTCATPGSATVSTPTFCTGPYTYLWSPGGQTTQTATGLASGIYTVTIGTASSCVTVSDTVTIVSVGGVNVTAASTGSTCTGGAVATVSTGTAPYTYSWNTGQTTSSITGVAAGTYTVNVTDHNGCTGSAVVTITTTSGLSGAPTAKPVVCFGGLSGTAEVTPSGGTAPYTYSWNTGKTTSSITGLGAGTYTCTVSDAGGCSDIITVTVVQPPQLRDSVLSSTDPTCFGLTNGNITVGVKGGAGTLTYSWNNGETALNDTAITGGTYTLTVTDSNGCVTKIVDSLKTPTQIVATVPPQSMCTGNSVTLAAAAVGGTSPYTFVWNGTTGNANYNVSPAATTTYTLVVKDSHGCSSAPVPVTVTVSPGPTVLFVPDTIQGCYPLCVAFKDATTLTTGTEKNWYWTFGDGDTSDVQNPVECYNKAGVFTVSLTVTTSNGCVAQLIVPNLITTYDHPHAAFTATPQPANIMQPFVQFTDNSTDQYGITSWFWTLGDATDSTSTNQNVGHTYHDTGTFCPNLVVTNIHQCTDSIQHCIVIDPLFTLYIPNAFTPNGDGHDDVFLAEGIYVCGFEMYIFDRWGQQLFHSTDIDKGWDGRVNVGGAISQEDTYVYLIYAYDCEKHQKHTYLGRVTLLK